MKTINKYLNNYGEEPTVKAVEKGQTAQFLRKQAEAQAKRNEARRKQRVRTEKAHEALRTQTGEAHEETTTTTEANGIIKELTNKSFLALYNSNRLILNGERLKRSTHKEELILKFLKAKNPTAELTTNGKHTAEIKELKQVNFKTDQANTPKALKYLLSFTGKAEKVTNTQINELQAEKPILSYNNIGYEPNEIVIIGREENLTVIKNEFLRLNKAEDNFYNFIDESKGRNKRKHQETRGEARTIKKTRPRPTGRLFKLYKEKLKELRKTHIIGYEHKKGEVSKAKKGNIRQREKELLKTLFNVTYYELEERPELIIQVQGLNNIKEDEKQALKRTPNHRKKETKATASELLEIAGEQDGRQTIKNIEYDLRTEATIKAVKAESSTALYFIIREIEEQAEQAEKGEKRPKAETKKTTALLNVLKSFKSTKELKEELEESITEQLEEADRQTEFKANKKGKNKYNTKTGLTRPNRKPEKKTSRINRELAKRPTEEAKAEIKEERQQKQANERNRPINLKEIQKGILKEMQNHPVTSEKIRREADRRKERRILKTVYGKELLKSVYGELIRKSSKTEKRQCLNELLEFKQANEI